MEVGRVAIVDQAQDAHLEKIQKVQDVELDKIDADEEYKNLPKDNYISDVNEVVIDNINFGYDKESEEFFIKVSRGNIESKYPTEDMMKLKSIVLEDKKIDTQTLKDKVNLEEIKIEK